MGNRDALLEAAKKCLVERGYSTTSARDIATEAGVSTAAIGYHFGTKDALLIEALIEALQEWSAALGERLVGAAAPDATPAERFTQNWDRVVETFQSERQLWRIQFDMLGAMDRNPRLTEILSANNREARLALVGMFGDPRGPDAPADDETEKLGSYYQSLLAGLSAQHLLDPATSLTGPELGRMITAVAGMLAS